MLAISLGLFADILAGADAPGFVEWVAGGSTSLTTFEAIVSASCNSKLYIALVLTWVSNSDSAISRTTNKLGP